MILPIIALIAAIGVGRACPIAANAALPELTGAWELLLISGLDRPRADTSRATSKIDAENVVVIRNRDHFSLTSRLSNDRGRTWQALSRWEYRRTTS